MKSTGMNTFFLDAITDAFFNDVLDTQENFNNVAAVILFLTWMSKVFEPLSATLSRSTKDIGGFAVMFAVLFFAYAQFGYLMFGTQVMDSGISIKNMLLPIINDSYVEVKAELARQQEVQRIFDWLRRVVIEKPSFNYF
ncbi:unnamed protein product [Angiostrongylus costaricensis]|uniref:PKD_channel domain-containing protein n=1 Tax=Angiostrongylus costaricensis TaxID=334426 RepID=A0A158PFZ3_ANGCS|nr:unnamed protein product [Angiostrongylus costaricensis]